MLQQTRNLKSVESVTFEANEEIFIEEVRKNQFLYNVHDKDYRDQKKRQEAWEEIGEKINRNWQECRDSWTKLRNSYTNALKRRRTTSGQAAKKISKWKFEEQMAFLAPFSEPRASESSFDTKNCVEAILTNDEMRNEEDMDEDCGTNSVCGVSNDSNFCTTPSNKKSSNQAILQKSMTDLVDVMKSNNQLRSKLMTSQSLKPPADEGNDIDLFFLSLSKSVNKLSQHEQVRLKMDISNLVFEAELRKISENAVTQPQFITVYDTE